MSTALFRALHDARSKPLVRPNAWDALSARLFESAGAEAVATTSAVLAWAHGYRDGEALPVDVLVNAISEITQRVRVPVSVDLERGYSESPEEVARLVERLVQAGAVGVNLEDAAGSAHLLADKIRAVRARLGAARRCSSTRVPASCSTAKLRTSKRFRRCSSARVCSKRQVRTACSCRS